MYAPEGKERAQRGTDRAVKRSTGTRQLPQRQAHPPTRNRRRRLVLRCRSKWRRSDRGREGFARLLDRIEGNGVSTVIVEDEYARKSGGSECLTSTSLFALAS